MAFKIQLGVALLVSGFCILTVMERITKAKHMQFLSGVSVLVYWLSALVLDFIIFFISCCFLLVSANNVLKVSFLKLIFFIYSLYTPLTAPFPFTFSHNPSPLPLPFSSG